MLRSKHFFLLFLLLSSSCAQTNHQAYMTTPAEPENYRAHPASYTVERFPVRRKINTYEDSPVPFYYQKCSRSVGNYIGTNSQYDCD